MRRTPLFKELTDDALRVEYRGLRGLAYNNAAIAQHVGPRGTDRLARQMGRLMRSIEIIEAIARKRGISLV